MKKRLEARLGIIFVSLALILSIIAFMLLNGSAAWFADNKDVTAGGFSLTVANDMAVIATLKSYPVTEINGSAYTLYKAAESYTLPTDDPSSISYSEYKKALVVIITVDAHESVNVTMLIDAAAGVDTLIAPALANYISNCIKVSAAELNSDGTVATKGATSQSFVNLQENPITKEESIMLLENDGVNEGETKDYCFIIEYDSDLLHYIGAKILEQRLNDNRINYSNDIAFQIHK